MPTAEGYLVYDTGATAEAATFTASFVIGNTTHYYVGNFGSEIPPFRCTTATLRYSQPTALQPVQGRFIGRVGKEGLTLNFSHEDRMSITGLLDRPIHKTFSISDGRGQWSETVAAPVPFIRQVPPL